ncbi:MAG: DNA-protecting protein DprA [Rhodospirillales bacterium]|nr:DNA-processing protein DprA [Alphaproteobacteria bacterium]USO03742.1 MAG: DNA-protecting protein DprA [Rhodospirillales bacterium]
MTLAAPYQAPLEAPLSLSEKLDWLRLIRTDNVGPVTFYRLMQRYGSAGKALEALPELSRRGGKAKALTPPSKEVMEQEYQALQKLGGDFTCACEADYPLPLGACEDAPPVISFLGDKTLMRRKCLAMVGARNASLNGRKFAEKLSRELGQAGQTIVSGLARGIDTATHQGALETGTIAIVAGGLDIIYPRENTDLYKKICEQGLVIAESPLGMEPLARHFPRRNRIVSGLSAGVVVVEATVKSGSLITARMAAEQGRDVYAVPGHPFDPRAAGPNRLIKDGATLVQSAQDILQNLSNFTGASLREKPQFSWIPQEDILPVEDHEMPPENVQALLLQYLSQTPIAVDELVRSCHLTIPVVQTALLEMELAGRIERLPGGRIVLIH